MAAHDEEKKKIKTKDTNRLKYNTYLHLCILVLHIRIKFSDTTKQIYIYTIYRGTCTNCFNAAKTKTTPHSPKDSWLRCGRVVNYRLHGDAKRHASELNSQRPLQGQTGPPHYIVLEVLVGAWQEGHDLLHKRIPVGGECKKVNVLLGDKTTYLQHIARLNWQPRQVEKRQANRVCNDEVFEHLVAVKPAKVPCHTCLTAVGIVNHPLSVEVM